MVDYEIANSDCMEVHTDAPDGTNLIKYSNQLDFDGLIYTDVEPKPIFEIRLTSKFFKERTPEENESENQSSDIAKLSGTIKEQKLLQIEPHPYFMHRKIKGILQHNSIEIEEDFWESNCAEKRTTSCVIRRSWLSARIYFHSTSIKVSAKCVSLCGS